ncbi:MAG TPA: alkaline phosphatase family protein [Actinomycetota bacterium]|nr:alkaline phosphatase family protein [Actinomycetota bacterium]
MRRLGALFAFALLAAACTSDTEPVAQPSATSAAGATSATGATGPTTAEAVAPTPGLLERAACSLPHEQLLRVWRGTDPERSGQIVFVADEPNFVGTSFPHSGPWDYLQDVPLFWYGPGVIPEVGRVDRHVTVADIAPTQAELLDFDFEALDGRPLAEIPAPAGPPPLIVTLVWDAGGMNVLEAFPNDWPVLSSLIEHGVWYEHASVGSSPSITPATHATIGTGAFPMRTGQTDAEFRLGDELVRAGELGPVLLMEPTLADLYDRAMGNESLVGGLASVTWHLNMASHGSLWGGGDRDIAVLRVPTAEDNEGAEGTTWNLQGRYQPFYEFPDYVNDLPELTAYTEAVDRLDGALDGNWRDNSIEEFEQGWATPARIPYQARMVEEVIAREGFGDDEVPDLLFVNFKAIDHVSHIWSANSPEMQDTLRAQDEDLGRFVEFLDEEVGPGRWALVLTADHGAQFDPAVSGAYQVPPPELERDLNEAFPSVRDASVFEAVRPSQIYVNETPMRASGYSLEQIASFVLTYTKGEGHPDGPEAVPEAERDDPVFAAAFPISILSDLGCLPEARS